MGDGGRGRVVHGVDFHRWGGGGGGGVRNIFVRLACY